MICVKDTLTALRRIRSGRWRKREPTRSPMQRKQRRIPSLTRLRPGPSRLSRRSRSRLRWTWRATRGSWTLSGARASAEPTRPVMLLVLDNYDSFTYNLVQYAGELGSEPVVYRNDEISVEAALELHPRAIVISP